jgi:hypothetical protein
MFENIFGTYYRKKTMRLPEKFPDLKLKTRHKQAFRFYPVQSRAPRWTNSCSWAFFNKKDLSTSSPGKYFGRGQLNLMSPIKMNKNVYLVLVSVASLLFYYIDLECLIQSIGVTSHLKIMYSTPNLGKYFGRGHLHVPNE